MSAQLPLFRPELLAQSEDEGGTAYVRITDPRNSRSHRLYALEYEVARAMDGRRSLSEIAAAVSSAQGVMPSLSDLQAFVAHLEGLGLVIDAAAAGMERSWPAPQGIDVATETLGAEANLAQPLERTATLSAPPEAPPGPSSSEAQALQASEQEVFSTLDNTPRVMTRPTLVLGEQDREGQGLAPTVPQHHSFEGSDTQASPQDEVHAGVYALVTEELDLHPEPKEPREHAGQGAAGAAAPRLATASETPTETDPPGQSSINVRVQASHARKPPSLWRRLLPPWFLAVVTFAVVALAALWQMGKIFAPEAPEVTVREARFEPRPRVLSQGAIEVQPARRMYLTSPSDGTLSAVSDVNTRVQTGQIVASLRMPDDDKQRLDDARIGLSDADTRITGLNEERAKLAARRKELQGQQLQPQGENRRRLQRHIARQLVQLDRRDRALRVALVDARSQHARVAVDFASLEKKLAPYLIRAPFDGVVGPARVAIGINLRSGQPVVVLEDRNQVTLTFVVPEGQKVGVGDTLPVLVTGPAGSGSEQKAIVDELVPTSRSAGSMPRIRASMSDAKGSLAQKAPQAFRLITGHARQAVWVPIAALGPALDKAPHSASLWYVEGKQSRQLGVEVIERREDGAWVTPLVEWTRAELALVVAASDGMMALKNNHAVRLSPEPGSTPEH